MGHPNKTKGNKFENDVRKVFEAYGFTAARIKAGWEDDQGDLEVDELPDFVWQCKNFKDVATGLREGVDGARVQRHKALKKYGVAVVKRRLKPTEEAYVAMSLSDFIEMIKDLKNYETKISANNVGPDGTSDGVVGPNKLR